MSEKKNNGKNHNSSYHKRNNKPHHSSQKVKNLEKQTGHGFQEYKDLEDLNTFFTSDPDEVPFASFEPPLFKKASKAQLARSEGKRK